MSIRLGDIIQITMIMAALFAGWYRFDNRIASVEYVQAQQVNTLKTVADQSTANTNILKDVTSMLKTFTPHIHSDGQIIYPDGSSEILGDTAKGNHDRH